MAAPKRLDFTSTGDVDFEDNSPPCSFSFSPRKSPRKRSATDAVALETDAKVKKKKKTKTMKKLASPVIWSEEDELTVLKGLVEYRANKGFEAGVDWDAFFCFIRGSIVAKISKEQLFSKLRKLKRKFLVDLERINGGNDPLFTRSSDSEAFGFAMIIWGNNDTVGKDEADQSKNGEETFKEDEEVANAEPLVSKNDFDGNLQHEEAAVDKIAMNVTARNESHEDDTHGNELCVVQELIKENEEFANSEPLLAKSDFDGKSQHEKGIVDGIAINTTVGKESRKDNTRAEELCDMQANEAVAYAEPLNENVAAKTDFNGKPHREKFITAKMPEKLAAGSESHDTDIDTADELCALQDAFDTMLSQGLSDFQKKLQLVNLMNLGAGKRHELSREWKELCREIAKLNIKKLKFSAKLAEAAATD